MKVLTKTSKREEKIKNMISQSLVNKLNDEALKEEHLRTMIDEVYKLGREAERY